MQFWLTCILIFFAGYFLMGIYLNLKHNRVIRIAIYDKDSGTKKIVTIDKGFDEEIDNLIDEIDRQQKQGVT